jgi:hypothetical protein
MYKDATAGTGGVGNVALLFGSDKKLIYSSSYVSGNVPNVCSGVGAVTATAAPAGAHFNNYGPTWVQTMSTAGKVQFATGNCGTGSTCTSNGMFTIDDILKPITPNVTTVSVTCPADSAADPAYLGFTYTSGAGTGGSQTYKVHRIVDPNGIFASETGCTGTCGAYEP